LAAEIAKTQKDADGRVKPGQGDHWLCLKSLPPPISFKPEAVDDRST
jgi:hypothetical protein